MSNSSDTHPHKLIGVAFACVATLDLLLYLPCLIVIRTDRKLKNHSCFQFMFHLGLSDLVNIAGQFTCGLWTITGVEIPHWVNKVFGACMAGGWFVYITLLHVIAVNRFVQMCCRAKYKHLMFSSTAVNLWLGFCWTHGFCWFVILLLPDCDFVYFPSILTWYYDKTTFWGPRIIKVNWTIDIVMLKASVLWYIAIVLWLRLRASKIEVSSRAQLSLRAKEKHILRQAALIGLYTFVWAQYWNIAHGLSERGFSHAYALGNFFWVTNSGVNPVVYLTMNRTINRKVRRMLVVGSNGPTRSHRRPITSATVTNGYDSTAV